MAGKVEFSDEMQEATGLASVHLCGYCFSVLFVPVEDLFKPDQMQDSWGWETYWWLNDATQGQAGLCPACIKKYMDIETAKAEEAFDGFVVRSDVPSATRLIGIQVINNLDRFDIDYKLEDGTTRPFRYDIDFSILDIWMGIAAEFLV